MYKITIEEIKEVEKVDKEYQIIADTGGEDNGARYGYVQTRNMVEQTTNIYTQLAENINLVSIIDAVNKSKLEVKEKK